MIDFNKIKLIVWDLDDTFWQGTLSEGGVLPVDENIKLVKDLTDIGIVNSICSKNDEDKTIARIKEMGVEDFFVFNSIDWTPKGQRIQKTISDMGLRAVNVLFLDDNTVNLNEAAHYSEGLMIAEPSVLPDLIKWVADQEKKDKDHKRLNQYKVLETKVKSRDSFSDNLDFLYSTDTRVDIHKDCLSQIKRLHELIMRTNQLNYTKKRISIEELQIILEDPSYENGYVTVKDKFGDYGIVGFFSVKDNKAEHFLFSCRTIGQGVEQWVYAQLGYPEVDVQGVVVNKLEKAEAPKWINMAGPKTKEESNNPERRDVGKVVFKGPCDLMSMTGYMRIPEGMIEEFNYISPTRKNSIVHHNHSTNYLNLPFYTEDQKKQLLDDCIFNDEGIFKTAIYDKDTKLVFLSTFHEPNWGIYRKKNTDIYISYGRWNEPLTDKNSWDFWLKFTDDSNTFTEEWLESFAAKYEFIGKLTPAESFENIKKAFAKMNEKAVLCLMLGSETPYLANKLAFRQGRELYYKELNTRIRKWAEQEPRVCYIDFNDFIKGQSSFDGNINHFTRDVYYKAAVRADEIILKVTGYSAPVMNKTKAYLKNGLKKSYLSFRMFLHKIKTALLGEK